MVVNLHIYYRQNFLNFNNDYFQKSCIVKDEKTFEFVIMGVMGDRSMSKQ